MKQKKIADREKRAARAHLRAVRRYIAMLRRNWTPRTKDCEHHGPEPGPSRFTLYLDEQNIEWTTMDIAFKRHVFRKISAIMDMANGTARHSQCKKG